MDAVSDRIFAGSEALRRRTSAEPHILTPIAPVSKPNRPSRCPFRSRLKKAKEQKTGIGKGSERWKARSEDTAKGEKNGAGKWKDAEGGSGKRGGKGERKERNDGKEEAKRGMQIVPVGTETYNSLKDLLKSTKKSKERKFNHDCNKS